MNLLLAFTTAALIGSGGPTLTARSSRYGMRVSDGRGYVLYAFTRDRGRSACYDVCAKAWPPYYAPKRQLRVGAGIKRELLGSVKRKNGRRQLTYAGRPLYYYVGDDGPGVIRCQDVYEFGGRWLIIRPSGKLIR
jgi:predicted lipoprotein with Yx(FWY)xxD motif